MKPKFHNLLNMRRKYQLWLTFLEEKGKFAHKYLTDKSNFNMNQHDAQTITRTKTAHRLSLKKFNVVSILGLGGIR